MNLGLVVMGGAILSNLLIQFSVDGLELCSLPAIYLGPNCGGGNEVNADLLQNIPCMYCYSPCPQPCSRPPPTHTFTGAFQSPTGKSGSVPCRVTVPFSWVLVHKLLLISPRVYFSVLCKFWQIYGEVNGNLLQEVAQRLKRLPPMQETQVRSLGWEDPLEKGMATHSSVLAWRIPCTV